MAELSLAECRYDPICLRCACPHRDQYNERCCGSPLTAILAVPAGDIDITGPITLRLTCWECGHSFKCTWDRDQIMQGQADYEQNAELYR